MRAGWLDAACYVAQLTEEGRGRVRFDSGGNGRAFCGIYGQPGFEKPLTPLKTSIADGGQLVAHAGGGLATLSTHGTICRWRAAAEFVVKPGKVTKRAYMRGRIDGTKIENGFQSVVAINVGKCDSAPERLHNFRSTTRLDPLLTSLSEKLIPMTTR